MERQKMFAAALLAFFVAVALFAGVQVVTKASAQPTEKTWYVSIGGSLPSYSTDEAFGFYPHMIVIDAGDTIVWTVTSAEPHTVTFFSGKPSFNGLSPIAVLPIPCSQSAPNVYNGSEVCSSGLLVQGEQYSLTFTTPGVYVYTCVLHPGLQGVVVVQPKGAPYPYTQEQYNVIAQQEMAMDLQAVQTAVDSYQVGTTSVSVNSSVYRVAVGYQPQEITTASLSPVGNSGVSGNVTVQVVSSQTAQVKVSLSGLTPGKSYSVQLLFGSSQYGEATGYSPINIGSFTPTSTSYSASFLVHQNLSLVAYTWIELPMAGLYMNVNTGSNTVASGDIMFTDGGIMGFLPSVVTIYAGDTVVWTELEQNDVHTVTYVPPGMPIPEFGTPQSFEAIGNNSVFDPSQYHNSGPLVYGQSYALTFDKPGVYTFVCLVHDEIGMYGYVNVLPRPSSTTHIVNQVTTVMQQTTLPGTTLIQHYNTTISTSTGDKLARVAAVIGILFGVVALAIAAVATRRR